MGFYDAAGNLVVDPQASSTTYVYDAWNRMVKVNSAGTAIASYAYDGRGRRVAATSSGTTVHDYFNDSWQVIEQRVGSSADPSAQFVWSNAYVNALVQERRDSDADGTLDRTLFVTHDANYNVTAAVRSDGVAAQRYLYDAYGERSVLDGTWQPFATPTPAVLQHGFQGGREDGRTKLIPFQRRYLNTSLHRWTTRDPAGYVDGGSLYGAMRGRPVDRVDSTGLKANTAIGTGVFVFGRWRLALLSAGPTVIASTGGAGANMETRNVRAWFVRSYRELFDTCDASDTRYRRWGSRGFQVAYKDSDAAAADGTVVALTTGPTGIALNLGGGLVLPIEGVPFPSTLVGNERPTWRGWADATRPTFFRTEQPSQPLTADGALLTIVTSLQCQCGNENITDPAPPDGYLKNEDQSWPY